ncbi:hypothetical protein, partial [Microbacterium maritypicum]|uniref:hypothetical protein n=1 Tax=Microbacterium maritypicum TaxID=33918 RepID=UPI00296E7CD8
MRTDDGGLSIDHGGAISVDTEQLRALGARMRTVVSQYEDARAAVARALTLVSSSVDGERRIDVGALQRSVERIVELCVEIENACTGTLVMADAFEVVELRAQAEALALTDAAAASAAQARADVGADELARDV